MKTSGLGLRLLERFEGFPNGGRPYNDPVGYATVGYGHLLHYSTVNAADRRGVWVAGQRQRGVLTRAEGSRLLLLDLAHGYEPTVRALHLPNQHMFDAAMSFVFNIGPGGVAANTRIGAALRRRAWREAADAMLAWDKAGGQVLEGLRIRREAERSLFLRPMGRFEDYTAHERELILSFDRLHGHTSRAAAVARAELRRQMRAECAVIQRAARLHGGWDVRSRRRRYEALARRVGRMTGSVAVTHG